MGQTRFPKGVQCKGESLGWKNVVEGQGREGRTVVGVVRRCIVAQQNPIFRSLSFLFPHPFQLQPV